MSRRARRQALALLSACALLQASASTATAAPADETGPTQAGEQSGGAQQAPTGESSRTHYGPRPGMEERVVTASETAASAELDAAGSVTGFGAADLDALGALSVADIGKYTPNLEIVTTGSTTPTFFIRGVGLNDFNANASGAVAVFQDEVAMNAPALQLGALFDTENVNVLRGPVGTGPSRNASAGAIKIYSRKPTGDFNGYLRSTFGKYMYRDFEGAVGAPIFEDLLSARIAFRVTSRDGYVTNLCGGAPPKSQRTKRLPGVSGKATDPRWSICGENVLPEGTSLNDNRGSIADGYSPIPSGLPRKVNDLGNWAARATLRFQPTLDTDWLLNVHGSSRDELSRQGLSYGVRPVETGPTAHRILVGADGGDYRRPQSAAMFKNLIEKLMAPLLVNCQPGCTRKQTNTAKRAVRPLAANATASQLAAGLDGDPYTGAYDRPGKTQLDTLGAYVNGSIVLPNEIELKTISAYDQYDRTLISDTDQTPNTLFEIGGVDQGWQFFQNLGLKGAFPGRSKGSWEAGGFYLMETLDVQSDNTFPPQIAVAVGYRSYTQKTWSFGVWQKLDWDFWNDFTLDGGVRYNWERKFIDYLLTRLNGAVTRTTTDQKTRAATTADVRLTYRFRENVKGYWKYSRGWKGGHYNATTPLRSPNNELVPQIGYAEPMTNDAFETGLAGAWFDDRIQLEFSLFHYDYSNYQLFTVKNEAGAPPEFIVINASDAKVYGSEVNLIASPWDNSRVTARFGWLESSFIDYVQLQSVERITPRGRIKFETKINHTGKRLLNSPQFKISLTGEQTVPLGRYGVLTLRYDTSWTDTSFFDQSEGRGLPDAHGKTFLPENTIAQGPFWLHNLLVRYRPPVGNMEIEGWVRNLTDQVYKTFAFDATQFQDITVFFTGEPRTWGLTLTVNF